MRSLFTRTIALLAGAIALASSGSSPGAAQLELPTAGQFRDLDLVRQTTTFGTLGIVDGQTVRLSAVRGGDEDQGVKVCTVGLNLFDIQGNRLAAVSASLDAGKAAFLDLARADIQPQPDAARAQIYAVVDVTSNSKDGKPSCQVAMSIEVFDQRDGSTRIYQGASSVEVGQISYACCICCERNTGTSGPACRRVICNSSSSGPPPCPPLSACTLLNPFK